MNAFGMNLADWLAAFSVAGSTLSATAAGCGMVQGLVFLLLFLLHLDYCDKLPPDRYVDPAGKCVLRCGLLMLLARWLMPTPAGPAAGTTLLAALCLMSGILMLGSRRWVLVGLLDMFPAPSRRQTLVVGVPLLVLGAWVG